MRKFPGQTLDLSLGGPKLIDVLDADTRLDEEALKIVQSIEDELVDRAREEYAGMVP